MSEKITLGGRRFAVYESTSVAQDSAIAELLARAGIDPFAPAAAGESEEAAALAFGAIHGAGVMLPLLGCMLLPEGSRGGRRSRLRRALERWGVVRRAPAAWTPELAAATAEFLGGIDDPRDKGQIYAIFAQVLIPFFVGGTSSSWRSPGSSRVQSGRTLEPPSWPTLAHGEA